MKLGERIRILRKDQGLSQAAFGARLGVSRSVINNLERGTLVNESAKRPVIKLMAKEFCVSEEWLLHGETARVEYLPERGTDILGKLKELGSSEFEIEMIRAYMYLDYVQRRIMLQAFRDLLNYANNAVKRLDEDE